MQYQFNSVKAYERQLTNVQFWRPAIDYLCKKHQIFDLLIDNKQIRVGLPGTNPVFILDGRFVIKFYEIHLFRNGD
ncbi:hypothetical protein I4U23_029705 [Adineta vaga]|nr:hypothetical protein I4U23_029705 [Adineta vaga]